MTRESLVIQAVDVSWKIAENATIGLTGIYHESPQIIVILYICIYTW